MSTKNWIEFPRVEGETSRQAHADLPAGTFEREIGRDGFFGPAAHIYHRHAPTGWTSFEGPLRPRAFDLVKLDAVDASPWAAPEILGNAALRLRYWHLPASMPDLARNGDGDELLFVHAGQGDLYCDYGHLAITAGDYLVLPRGTMWRIDCAQPMTMLMVEATGSSYRLPDRGLVGAHAIFDPAILDVPAIDDAFRTQQGEREWKVRIKRRGVVSTVTYPFNPLDAVGWTGERHHTVLYRHLGAGAHFAMEQQCSLHLGGGPIVGRSAAGRHDFHTVVHARDCGQVQCCFLGQGPVILFGDAPGEGDDSVFRLDHDRVILEVGLPHI